MKDTSKQRLRSGQGTMTPEDEFLDSLEGYTYEYKPEYQDALGLPSKRQYGVMAQDVERTPLGKSFVEDTPNGKVLDTVQGFGSTLAGLGRLNQRLRSLEANQEASRVNGELLREGRKTKRALEAPGPVDPAGVDTSEDEMFIQDGLEEVNYPGLPEQERLNRIRNGTEFALERGRKDLAERWLEETTRPPGYLRTKGLRSR